MKIEKLTSDQLPAVKDLLQKNNLPTEDINNEIHLFGIYEDQTLIGVAGIELHGTNALMRSVCVDEAYRSQGMAEILTQHIEQYAKEAGTETLYLLTTTAENYFKRKGFTKIERTAVPEKILQTSEFSSVCPSSATVMQKNLLLQ